MCIIAFKEAGFAPLGEEVLKSCWDSNQDGAGFAYWNIEEQLWHVKKGFMTFDSFWNGYSGMNFTNDDIIACHFRVGTAGNLDGGNTHPFPICDNYDTMRVTEFSSNAVAIHNGVIGVADGIASDTMAHIKTYLAPMLPYLQLSEDKEAKLPPLGDVMELVLSLDKNKWVLLMDNTYSLHGKWDPEDKKYPGVRFSNNSYKILRAKYRKPATTHYSNSTGMYNTEGVYTFPAGGKYAQDQKHREAMVNNKSTTNVDDNGNIIALDMPGFNVPKMRKVTFNKTTGELFYEEEKLTYDMDVFAQSCPGCYEDSNMISTSFLDASMSCYKTHTLCYTCGSIFDNNTGAIETYVLPGSMHDVKIKDELVQIDNGLFAKADGTIVEINGDEHDPDNYEFASDTQMTRWSEGVTELTKRAEAKKLTEVPDTPTITDLRNELFSLLCSQVPSHQAIGHADVDNSLRRVLNGSVPKFLKSRKDIQYNIRTLYKLSGGNLEVR